MSKPAKNDYDQFFQGAAADEAWPVLLLRDVLLPNLLERDLHDILYWAGKNLAIKFPQTTESLVHFFEVSDFGNLVLTKQTADKTTWKLSGPTISKRLAADQDADFMLETGFLAQTQQQTTGLITEAEYKLRNKGIIEIMVVSDSNQPLPY